MNGPTSRWIHRESFIPYFHLPLPLAKESQKFLLPRPWVRAAHLSAWSIQEQLTSMIIFHSVVKPFPLHSWRALTLYFYSASHLSQKLQAGRAEHVICKLRLQRQEVWRGPLWATAMESFNTEQCKLSTRDDLKCLFNAQRPVPVAWLQLSFTTYEGLLQNSLVQVLWL